MMEKCRCVGCVYLDAKDTFSTYRCKLNKGVTQGNFKVAKCMFDRTNISKKKASKVLHDFQKYRRGATELIYCPPPYVIGIAIDKAINAMRSW